MTEPLLYTRSDLRRQRRKVRFDAWFGAIAMLILGFCYAQIARKLGAPSPVIGLTAVACQLFTFAAVMLMRPSDLFYRQINIGKHVGKLMVGGLIVINGGLLCVITLVK